MDRNIKLAYLLAYLKNSWFWLGVWVFYYLRFTNYAGIGLIETVMIVTMTVCEIPTGAIADLLGKKNTLIVSYFIQFFGNIIMAFTPNFTFLIFSVFILSVGGTLYSGTMDALVYDSLKQNNRQKLFDKVISNIASLQLIAIVVCGLVSGFLYSLNPSLPFLVAALFYFVGFFLCFFLIEPKIDSLKFSFVNFIIQTKTGFMQLFKNIDNTRLTILLFIVLGIYTFADEMGETILSYEYGITASQIGIFFAIIYLIAAIVSQLTSKISNTKNYTKLIFTFSFIIAITFILSPFVGLLIGCFILIIRQSLATIFNNLSSVVINQNTPSSDRATTISTFNMFKNLPYVFGAVYIGHLMDLYSAKVVYSFLGLAILILITIQALIFPSHHKQYP